MNYNKNRYLELLRRSQDLEKKGKSLSSESREDYLELLEYGAAVQDHIFWKDWHRLALLMENFINGMIDGEEFSDNVFGLHRKNINAHDALKVDFEKLEDFQPDLRSKGFSRFISFSRSECEDFVTDSTLVELGMVRENYEYTEEQLKNSIQKVLIEMKERYPEDSKENI